MIEAGRISRAIVGPEIVGRGWCVVGHISVQVIERGRGRARRYVVALLHPGRRIDMRWGERAYVNLRQARRAALALARIAAGGQPLDFPAAWRGVGDSIWGIRCGEIFCAEALA